MDDFIRQYARENNLSYKRAKRNLEAAEKFRDECEAQLAANPFDRSWEELTEGDVFRLRRQAAEQGIEWTPQEVRDAVEIMRFVRSQIRGDG
jgi:hypothetical protein